MLVAAPPLPAVAPRYVMPPTHAAGLVEVEYDALPAVASVSAAAEADAPLVDLTQREHSNIVFRMTNASGDVDDAFSRADPVIRLSLSHARLAGIPIEPRGTHPGPTGP
jgi:carbon-monoxide dehydrogenase large subunit